MRCGCLRWCFHRRLPLECLLDVPIGRRDRPRTVAWGGIAARGTRAAARQRGPRDRATTSTGGVLAGGLLGIEFSGAARSAGADGRTSCLRRQRATRPARSQLPLPWCYLDLARQLSRPTTSCHRARVQHARRRALRARPRQQATTAARRRQSRGHLRSSERGWQLTESLRFRHFPRESKQGGRCHRPRHFHRLHRLPAP